MDILITTLHVLTGLMLITVVLLQHGKGADIGAAFGAGASQTVFGSAGAGNFLTKLTTGAAIIFMLTSLTLSYFRNPPLVTDQLEEAAVAEAPIEPEAPASSFPEAPPIQEGEAAADASAIDLPEGFESVPAPAEGEPPAPAEAPTSP